MYDFLSCISSPYAYIDPLHANMNSLFVELFKDSLNEYAYDAAIAGLRYNLANSAYGIEVLCVNIALCDLLRGVVSRCVLSCHHCTV